MLDKDRCPICWAGCKENDEEWGTYLYCDNGHMFTIHASIEYGDQSEVIKRYNLITERILRKPFKVTNDIEKLKWKFFYEESTVGQEVDDIAKVNIANDMLNYPYEFSERIDRILLNISHKYPLPQDSFIWEEANARLLFCESADADPMRKEAKAVLDLAVEMNYLKYIQEKARYAVSANGWKRIGELKKAEQGSMQGFIAMKFSEETKSIREAFKDAIKSCNYMVAIIDEKEHNNQIVPEIFSDIKNSKFVVVDVTYPNFGAYYEAGYAQGLNKEVIVCCKKSVFENPKENPHFDISQKSMVIWNDEKELVEKLVRRINATVGKNLKL